eukprot:scaffold124319_cov85-Cyclotella_meneghiniana.AAC.8
MFILTKTITLLLAPLARVQCFNVGSSPQRPVHIQFVSATDLTAETNEEKLVEEKEDDEDVFTLVSSLAATTLLQSDRRRDAIGKDVGAQASSATNWIDEGSSFRLKSLLNKLELRMPSTNENSSRNNNIDRERQDEAVTWLRWMRSIPSPLIVELSSEARIAANKTVSDEFLHMLNLSTENDDSQSESNVSARKIQQIRNEFLSRLGCKLILLPSGQGMQGSLLESNGSLIFGKLLYGGCTRYRILPSSNVRESDIPKPPRKAGERTERKTSANDQIPCWVQYGGTERR